MVDERSISSIIAYPNSLGLSCVNRKEKYYSRLSNLVLRGLMTPEICSIGM
jgi:hypothetical protein